MKFFIRFFIFIAVVCAIIIGIFLVKERGPKAAERFEKNMEATFIDDKNKPAPGPKGPDPKAQAKHAAVQQAAGQAGVQVTGYQDYGTVQDVALQWSGANQNGANFLDALMKQGVLVNFQEIAPLQGAQSPQGGTMYTITYRLTLK